MQTSPYHDYLKRIGNIMNSSDSQGQARADFEFFWQTFLFTIVCKSSKKRFLIHIITTIKLVTIYQLPSSLVSFKCSLTSGCSFKFFWIFLSVMIAGRPSFPGFV